MGILSLKSLVLAVVGHTTLTTEAQVQLTPNAQFHLQNSGRWDKAKTYGDPTLIPTRLGEHIRQEIALAGEISKALTIFKSIQKSNVNVNLPQSSASEGLPRILVTGQLDPSFDASKQREIETKIRSIVVSIVPNSTENSLDIVLEKTFMVSRQELPAWVWPFICLGLGASAGTIIERIRRKKPESESAKNTKT